MKPQRVPRRHREDDEQMALIAWANLCRFDAPPEPSAPKIGDYLFAIPNGGKRSPAEAARLKLAGVKAGVSDLFLPVQRKGYAGLWIELKAPAATGTAKGAVSPDQRKWTARMLAAGYLAVVCYGWDDAKKWISDYLGVRS